MAHDVRWRLLAALAQSDYRVQELVALLQQPANLLSYHLKRLRQEHFVSERRSTADGRDVYYTINLATLRAQYVAAADALHPALTQIVSTQQSATDRNTYPAVHVLFLCTHNSARSQMAEALLRHLSGGQVIVESAGSDPTKVHPYAVKAMADIGIDMSQQYAKSMSEFRGQSFDYIVTVCDRVREACPTFPNDPERIHWSFADPTAEEGSEEIQLAAFKRTAQELTIRINFLLLMIQRGKGKTV
jgi:protein-tyrosine-phosphatase